jgi:hypothetical protein
MNDAVELGGTLAPAGECDWPITNCYVDAWMLVLGAWGMNPLAGLGVTVAQDYEGDQFTFFKYLHEDLERLYGVIVGELSIWHALEEQIATQVRLGRLVLMEADGYYLPDTRATSYRAHRLKIVRPSQSFWFSLGFDATALKRLSRGRRSVRSRP